MPLGNFGIGGNSRTSNHEYTTTNTNLGGQVQTGSVSNNSQPVNLSFEGKYAGADSTINLTQTDHGAVQAGAELGQLAVVANTAIAQRALDGAAFGVDLAGLAVQEASKTAKGVTDFSLKAIDRSMDFGEKSLDVSRRSLSDAYSFGGKAIDKSLSFASRQADNAFEVSLSAQEGYERLARESLAASQQVAREAMSAASAGINAGNDANARALQFAEDYTRSDSADTMQALIKYGSWALMVFAAAYAFKGVKA